MKDNSFFELGVKTLEDRHTERLVGKVVPLHHLLKGQVGRKPCYIILAQGGLQCSSLALKMVGAEVNMG